MDHYVRNVLVGNNSGKSEIHVNPIGDVVGSAKDEVDWAETLLALRANGKNNEQRRKLS